MGQPRRRLAAGLPSCLPTESLRYSAGHPHIARPMPGGSSHACPLHIRAHSPRDACCPRARPKPATIESNDRFARSEQAGLWPLCSSESGWPRWCCTRSRNDQDTAPARRGGAGQQVLRFHFQWQHGKWSPFRCESRRIRGVREGHVRRRRAAESVRPAALSSARGQDTGDRRQPPQWQPSALAGNSTQVPASSSL